MLETVPEESLPETNSEKMDLSQSSHLIIESSKHSHPHPRTDGSTSTSTLANKLSTMEIRSTSKISETAKQAEVEHRGKLLGQLLADESVNGDLGANVSDDDNTNADTE